MLTIKPRVRIYVSMLYRVNLLCSLTVKALSTAFSKEVIKDRVLLESFKRNTPPALYDTDLLWKVNHKLRKKNASKQEMLDVIQECLFMLSMKDIVYH